MGKLYFYYKCLYHFRILDTLLVLLCDEVSEIRVNAGETTCSLIRLANQLHTKIDQSHQMSIPANNDLHYNNAVYQVCELEQCET